MTKTNLTNREIRAAREALVNAHSANRDNGPAATVAALVESLGYDRAREIVALMTAARGDWDARISRDSRAWAASVTSTTESELADRCIYYCDEIHPAHFEQIAQAMQQYQPAQDEPKQDEQQPGKEPVYLDERQPESNRIPGIHYCIWYENARASGTINRETVEDVRAAVAMLRRGNEKITRAIRFDDNTGEQTPFIPETCQEKTDRENREHCKHIANELDAYAGGLVYECPECGEYIRVPDLDALTTETEDGETLYRLPCGCTVDEEPEQRDLYDYLADVLDVEYRIEHSDRETVRSVRVMVAFGGPNIYIDSASRAVELYWWTDRASYPISSAAADELDDWAQELWSCC